MTGVIRFRTVEARFRSFLGPSVLSYYYSSLALHRYHFLNTLLCNVHKTYSIQRRRRHYFCHGV